MKKLFCIAAVATLFAAPTLAQDEIVVTGQRISSDYADDIGPVNSFPVVEISRRADNLIVAVRVVNDTRDAVERRNEITQTLRALVRSAGGRADIDLSIEEDGALVPLTEDMVSSLTLGADSMRADTSVATLIAKTPVRENDTLDAASGRLEGFVRSATRAGRSLVEIYGSWQLTLINPPQYRPAILAAIAADARSTAAAFGEGYAVEVSGLSSRVAWRQSGPLDLSLYVPYSMTITPRP